MKISTKQRLIGGAVFLIVLVIILMILFHHGEPTVQLRAVSNQAVPTMVDSDSKQITLRLPHSSQVVVEKMTSSTVSKATLPHMSSAASSTPAVMNHILHTHSPQPAKMPLQHKITLAHQQPRHRQSHKHRVQLQPNTVPKAWVVQVASFSNHRYAQVLTRKLRQHGYSVFMRTAQLNKRKVTRVYIGPDIRYQHLQHLQSRLKRNFNLSGVIRRYVQ